MKEVKKKCVTYQSNCAIPRSLEKQQIQCNSGKARLLRYLKNAGTMMWVFA